MTRDIAYSNGEFIPAHELVIPPQDMGFMWGVTVAEQLRSFRGKLFELDRHLDRLRGSLEIVGIDVDVQEVAAAAQKVATENYAHIDDGDMGLTIYATPGISATYQPGAEPAPRVGIHSYLLPARLWANKYESGQRCEIVSIPQVNESCWPRELKCRSRMHYYMADHEARTVHPSARAILLDDNGNVNEASTANVIAYFEDEGIVSPPRESILPGVSLDFVQRLAASLECRFTHRHLSVDELMQADEIMLTSTPFCILPVSQLGDRSLQQRHCFRWLMKAWNHAVGFDIAAQALRMAAR